MEQVFGRDVYLLSEAYDDEQLVALLGRACEATGAEMEPLLHDFGVFTAERTFTRLYPAFFAIAPSAREFVLTVETRIHELVRATIPKAKPPELGVTELRRGRRLDRVLVATPPLRAASRTRRGNCPALR